jgi:uncharacterized protein
MAMSGETDLSRLLAGLDPVLDPDPYGYALLGADQTLPAGITPFGLVREAEGMTIIATCTQLEAAGLDSAGQWARITMMVHSALEAVGMTAAMATALTGVGISANVVAAYHHDHLFVPWDRREQALTVLRRLG